MVSEPGEHFAEGFPLKAQAGFHAEQLDDRMGPLVPGSLAGRDSFEVTIAPVADPLKNKVEIKFLEQEEFLRRIIVESPSAEIGKVAKVLESDIVSSYRTWQGVCQNSAWDGLGPKNDEGRVSESERTGRTASRGSPDQSVSSPASTSEFTFPLFFR